MSLQAEVSPHRVRQLAQRQHICSQSTPARRQKRHSLRCRASHGELPSRRQCCAAAGLVATACLAQWCPVRAEQYATSSEAGADTTVTDRVFLDVGLCPKGLRQNRTLGDKSALCSEAQPLGRIVIGLYGRQVPQTVQNFLTLVRSGAYTRTTFNKILPGQYIQAGRQGSPRMGQVSVPADLPSNSELLSPRAFQLEHRRPGTVSLSLAQGGDDLLITQRSNYKNTGFLITTGPGPVPSLDGQAVVFGRVESGLSTVAAISTVPTLQPSTDRIRAFNTLASFLGDDRADKVRKKWGQPLKAVVLTDCGVLS